MIARLNKTDFHIRCLPAYLGSSPSRAHPTCLDADDELPGHTSFLLCRLSEERRFVARAGTTARLQQSSDWTTENPFRHGSLPLGNCFCFMLCWTEVTVRKMGYHSCHVVILDPVTLPQQTGRMEEGCQDVCGYVLVDDFRYLSVSFCLCII